MEIAYNRFSSEVVSILQDVADSHFVAFDLEFSGISGPSQQRAPGKPKLQDLYEETRAAAVKYQILQVGLTVVKEDLENGQYIVKPYNFNINPLPTLRERQFSRDWSLSSGAVQFLLKNNFDFGTPLISGIPYLSRAEEVQVRMKLNGENERKLPDMELKAEDENLIKHIRSSVATWQEQPEDVREGFLNIPNDDRGKGVPGALNRYQMRLTHQVVQNEFPQLKTASMREFVQITNPTVEQRERQKVLQQEHIDREVGRAIGFRWILEAITGRDISGMPDDCFLAVASQFGQAQDDSTPYQNFVTNLNRKLAGRRKVLIGHNCMTDLIFLHQFLLGELPNRLVDFQESIHEVFPAIVDTKHLASFGNGRWGDTSLEAVEDDLRVEDQPKIVIPAEFDRYSHNERPHEAGYDALLTAKIAIKLSAKMEREGVYLDEQNARPEVTQAQRSPRPFGTREEGYVTASEDVDGRSSPDMSHQEISQPQAATVSADHDPDSLSTTEAFISTNTQIADTMSDSSTATPSTFVAVKERKPKLHHKSPSWSSSELEKVRPTFAAMNIYDILENDASNENLISSSDAKSALAQKGKNAKSPEAQKRSRIDEMVKQGKLMPRWDGANGFWRVFGNKLQVNQSKEGVLELGER